MEIFIDEEIKEFDVNSIWNMFNMQIHIVYGSYAQSEFQAEQEKTKTEIEEKNLNATKLRAEHDKEMHGWWFFIIWEFKNSREIFHGFNTHTQRKTEAKYEENWTISAFSFEFSASFQHWGKINWIFSLSQMVCAGYKGDIVIWKIWSAEN